MEEKEKTYIVLVCIKILNFDTCSVRFKHYLKRDFTRWLERTLRR